MIFKSRVTTFMNDYIKSLKLNISFDYDFKYMQNIYEKIPDDAKAFASNKLVKEILSVYFQHNCY